MSEIEHLAFSADLPARFSAGPPGQPEIASVADLILLTTDPAVEYDDFEKHPPILMREFPDGPAGPGREPDPISLGQGVELTRIGHEQAERTLTACSPRGHYFSPVRQFGQRYTLLRRVSREEWEKRGYGWDDAGLLNDVLQLSRLILDHGWSSEFAARLVEYDDGQQQIVWQASGESVYRLRPARDWLTMDEVRELQALLKAYWASNDDLPPRVRRALWNVEYMCRVRWLDLRVPLLVIAFEGLVSTSQALVARQFRERVPSLAADVGIDGVTTAMCANLYQARSRWAHGSHIALRPSTSRQGAVEEELAGDGDQLIAELDLFQTALRQTVRRCIEDPELAAVFADEVLIRERWPVTI